MSLTWQFDVKGVDEGVGWNNALVGEFKGNKLKALFVKSCRIVWIIPKRVLPNPLMLFFKKVKSKLTKFQTLKRYENI